MENIDYSKLKENLWKFHEFVSNKKIIDNAFKNNNIEFITWFKEELEKSSKHIIIEYFRLKYFPLDYKETKKDIRVSFDTFLNEDIMFEDDWYDDYYEKSKYNQFIFLSDFYNLLKENGIDVKRPFFANDFNTAYNDAALSCLKQGQISVKDVNYEIFKEKDYDFEDVINSYDNLVNNYPNITFKFDDRVYYILRYYIDKYGYDEGMAKAKEKDLLTSTDYVGAKKVFSNAKYIDTFYLLYNKYSNLFSKEELKAMLDEVFSDSIKKGVFQIENIDEKKDDDLRNICYMLESFGYKDESISIKDGEKRSISSIIDADKYYDQIVSSIKQYNFSPLETYICVYLLSKNYKDYRYYNNSRSDDTNYKAYSRNAYLILDNDWAVCAGYVAMANLLLERLNIKSRYLTLSNTSLTFNNQAHSGHARLGVIIEDDKYKLKSAYIGDPTFDCRGNGIYNIEHMFMEPQKNSDDGFKLDGNEFIDECATNNLSYNVPTPEMLSQAISTVINKTLSDLDQNQRDEIVREIIGSLDNGKSSYERLLKNGSFENYKDFLKAFEYKTNNMPLMITGLIIDGGLFKSHIAGFELSLETNNKDFKDALLESPEYTTNEDDTIKTPMYENTIEGFEKLTDYIQLKYLVSSGEKENNHTLDQRKK